jgi:hypothetical protein
VRCGRRWRAVLTHPLGQTRAPAITKTRTPRWYVVPGYGLLRRSPSSRRPDRRRFARRHPESRALRVAMRWPPATLDTGHRRAEGLAIGSVALSWPATFAHPARTPEPVFMTSRAREARVQKVPKNLTWAGEAFAMRRSGVRIPSAPPNPLVRGRARILKEGNDMASQQLVSRNSAQRPFSSGRLDLQFSPSCDRSRAPGCRRRQRSGEEPTPCLMIGVK